MPLGGLLGYLIALSGITRIRISSRHLYLADVEKFEDGVVWKHALVLALQVRSWWRPCVRKDAGVGRVPSRGGDSRW